MVLHSPSIAASAIAAPSATINTAFPSLDLEGRLRLIFACAPGRIVFTTSFGLEDQVITHVIAVAGLPVEWVTLDTGRLFPQTYALWGATERRYGLRVRAIYPDTAAVQALVKRDGIEGMRETVEARKACCAVRKVEPLGRALAGAAVWIAGLRAEQSAERGSLAFAGEDAGHGVVKVLPVLDHSRDALLAFAAAHDIPVNPLHAEGYPSIGCAPCTRAVAPGEPERAGRWWWEQQGPRECGLHLGADGKLARQRVEASP